MYIGKLLLALLIGIYHCCVSLQCPGFLRDLWRFVSHEPLFLLLVARESLRLSELAHTQKWTMLPSDARGQQHRNFAGHFFPSYCLALLQVQCKFQLLTDLPNTREGPRCR